MSTMFDMTAPSFTVLIPNSSIQRVSNDILDVFGMSNYDFTASVISHSLYVTKDRESDLVVCMDQFLVETFPENLYRDLRSDAVWLSVYEDAFLRIVYSALRYLEPVLSGGITNFFLLDTDQGFYITLIG